MQTTTKGQKPNKRMSISGREKRETELKRGLKTWIKVENGETTGHSAD